MTWRSSSGRASHSANVDEQEQEEKALELTLQVWDEDEGEAADFLGELKFDAQALLDMARERLNLVRSLNERSSLFASVGRYTSKYSSANTHFETRQCEARRGGSDTHSQHDTQCYSRRWGTARQTRDYTLKS